MTDHDWERLQDLFHETLGLDTADRRAHLARACPDRPDLRARVDAMVRGHRTAGGRDLLRTSVEAAARSYGAPARPSLVGARLGAYRITEELGRGGMGTVYRAVRADGEYEGEAALKIVRAAVLDDDLFRRFLAERRILAGLRHPDIATLMDAGTTPEGLPYMVMELVEGEPITHYCDRRRLGLRGRLDLFLRICEAVAFAHRNLVVHRDLKPSNILVTPEGQPKLMDFGIAKLLEDGLDDELTRTQLGVGLTPAYASPEQVAGDRITVATDVYGLGLVLYELLSGRRAQRVGAASPAEVERVVCRRDPPSLRSAAEEEDPKRIALLRGTTPRRLGRALAGDLETVVGKALRKDPGRRYGSVAELAADVEAVQHGRPVSARPDTWRYRLARFVQRNAAAVAAGAAAACVFAVLAGTLVLQSLEVRRERDLAERRRAVAAEASDFLVSVFDEGDVPLAPEEVLARGEERIAALADQPAVQAGMMDVVGRLYLELGLPDAAEGVLLQARERRRELFGSEDPDYGASLAALGVLRTAQGDPDAAVRTFRDALAVQVATLGPSHSDVLEARLGLARALGDQGAYASADSVYRLVLAARDAVEPGLLTAEIRADQAELLAKRGLRTAALDHARASRAIRERLLEQDHPDVAYARIQVERLAGEDQPGPLAAGGEAVHRARIPTPYEVVAGDFDGDGAEELLWNHRAGHTNVFYRSDRPDGPVSRHPVETPPAPWNSFSLHVGDFDGDGRDDLAWNARGLQSHVYLALSRPDGSVRYTARFTHPYGLGAMAPAWLHRKPLVHDLNRDGRDDFVWHDAPRFYFQSALAGPGGVLEPGPQRTMGRPPPTGPQLVNGELRDFRTFPGGETPRVLPADLDGDGFDELVWSWLEDRNETWALWWHEGEPVRDGPAFQLTRGAIWTGVGVWHYYEPLSGDVDGDGRDDVIWADPATPHPPADVAKRVYVGRSTSGPVDLALRDDLIFQDDLLGRVPEPLEVRTGDVDGDGRTDLIWNLRSAAGENRLWITRGRDGAVFEEAPPALLHPAGADWSRARLLVADLEGDGRDEIVWNFTDALNRVFTASWRGAPDG